MNNAALRPRNEMVRFLSKRIEDLKGVKSQREIAADLGYERPNIISMFKQGDTKVPLDKIPALAKSLEVDFGYLLRLGIEQFMTGETEKLAHFMDRVVSDDEWEVVRMLRDVASDSEVVLDDEKRTILRDAVKKAWTGA